MPEKGRKTVLMDALVVCRLAKGPMVSRVLILYLLETDILETFYVVLKCSIKTFLCFKFLFSPYNHDGHSYDNFF